MRCELTCLAVFAIICERSFGTIDGSNDGSGGSVHTVPEFGQLGVAVLAKIRFAEI
jgi:hypothetical protein